MEPLTPKGAQPYSCGVSETSEVLRSDAEPADAPRRDRVLDTYRYLRIATPMPVLWLLLAMAVIFVQRGEVLDSISDYYAGPLRDVFVGGLMASGLGMIVYKGESALEDYALNFAGFNAFLVALVSNSFQDGLDVARRAESTDVPPPVSSADLLGNLHAATWTLLVVTLAFVLVDNRVMGWTGLDWRGLKPLPKGLIVLSWAGETVLLAIVATMLFGGETILGRSVFSTIHFVAAGLLVANLSFAAASHAAPQRLRSDQELLGSDGAAVRHVFKVVTGLMWLGLAGGGVAILAGVPYAVLLTEIYEVVLFLVFWFTATRDEWRRLRPGTPSAAQAAPAAPAPVPDTPAATAAAPDPR